MSSDDKLLSSGIKVTPGLQFGTSRYCFSHCFLASAPFTALSLWTSLLLTSLTLIPGPWERLSCPWEYHKGPQGWVSKGYSGHVDGPNTDHRRPRSAGFVQPKCRPVKPPKMGEQEHEWVKAFLCLLFGMVSSRRTQKTFMWPESAHHHAKVAPVNLEAKLSESWVLRHIRRSIKAGHGSFLGEPDF